MFLPGGGGSTELPMRLVFPFSLSHDWAVQGRTKAAADNPANDANSLRLIFILHYVVELNFLFTVDSDNQLMNSHCQNPFEEINSIKNSCFIYEKLISVSFLQI